MTYSEFFKAYSGVTFEQFFQIYRYLHTDVNTENVLYCLNCYKDNLFNFILAYRINAVLDHGDDTEWYYSIDNLTSLFNKYGHYNLINFRVIFNDLYVNCSEKYQTCLKIYIDVKDFYKKYFND